MRGKRSAQAMLAALLLIQWAASGCGDKAAAGTTASADVDVTVEFDVGQVDTTDVTDDAADVTQPDDTTAEVATLDVGPGSDATADTAKPEDGACTEAGCACTSGNQCDSGVCIEVDGGKECATLCLAGCPSGFKCAQLAGAGGDIASICVPATPRLCEPCAADSDCNNVLGGADNRCVPYKDKSAALLGNFCASPCSASEPCPSGYACEATTSLGGVKSSQCVRQDQVCPCDKRATQLGLGTVCSVSNDIGSCAGKRSCGVGGLSPCDAPAAKAEQCNLTDDDCDGQTDEPSAGMCDDGTPCSYDNCIAGECQHPPKVTDCDDGSACTSDDTCQGLQCAGKTVTCDDGDPCTTDSCDPAKGCVTTAATGPACDDGNVCTENDACKSGLCAPGTAKVCDDNNPCTTDSCDAKAGCGAAPNTMPCDDNSVCTVGDVCKDGACLPGKAVICNDGNPCTDDSCDAKTGCEIVANTGPCSDSNVCTTGDVCEGGACAPGKAIGCDDNNPCTTDSCEAKTGCASVPNALPCSDGSACTQLDICQAGQCAAGSLLDCGDGNPCTDDACDPVKGCVHSANTAPCNDNNGCTEGDTCSGGVCVPAKPSGCDDKNPCTTESCDPVAGCQVEANTLPCSDDSVCTVGDSCAGGLCAPGNIVSCDDGNPCTNDSCDSAAGCIHQTNSAACSDGNVCTLLDNCKDGLCVPGLVKPCEDGNVCSDDGCDPKTGCVSQNNTAPCSDGSVCTLGDTCSGGSCKAGLAVTCNDGNPCTDDSCDAVSGCQIANNALACDDNNGCTTGDVCSSGSCKGKAGCDANAQCLPSGQNVACTCKAGYSGDGFTCADVNECLVPGTCAANMDCANTPGSFTCVCKTSYADCDKLAANGCEVNTATSAAHCGGCGSACSANNIAAPSCAAGVCNGTCNGGFADCNSNKLSDGCEVSTTDNNANCGSCGNACGGNQVCKSSVCQAVGTGKCVSANGLSWCYDAAKCGVPCAALCASMGKSTVDAGTWFAAQNSQALCQNIANALGGFNAVSVAGYTYACLEDSYGTHDGSKLAGPDLLCSTEAACPSAHLNNMDQLGVPCGPNSRLAICPCK